jgi:Autotransporter beta-domain/Bacterial Ig-like domain (group 3)
MRLPSEENTALLTALAWPAFDGGVQIGVATLAGGKASLTTSSLTVGSHSITAKYSGDGSNAGSTSAVLIQTINVPADSIHLREMQVSTMPMIAQASGQAISGAIDSAIAAGFAGNPKMMSPNGAGFTYYFGGDTTAQPQTEDDSLKRFLKSPDNPNARVDDSFHMLGYAGPLKAPPPAPTLAQPRTWLAWIDFRGTDYNTSTLTGDVKGTQVNATTGLTHLITPNLLVGVLGGYEHFDYNSQGFSSVLRGDGWTTGGYFGWRIGLNWRFDASAAWTDILANDYSGAANGNFTGSRWLAAGGLTGNYRWQHVAIEPSARVYALWERENAYTDSLGTLQPVRSFETGRASGGTKVSYPLLWSGIEIVPYAGLYGDYYFSGDNALTPGLTTVPLLQGWSARATGGAAASFVNGMTIAGGGEYSGLGGNNHIWTWTLRGRVPF